MKNNPFIQQLKQSYQRWSEVKASRLAAALSYYTMFALAPLLVILIAGAGFLFGEAAVQGRLVTEIEGAVGAEAAEMIQTMVLNTRGTQEGLIASLIGIILLLFGAAGLFSQLQESLNIMWGVQPKPGGGIGKMVRMRLPSFVMVLFVALLLAASLVASTVLAALSGRLAGMFPGADLLFWALNWLVSFLAAAFLFALVFKILPDAQLEWKSIWPGAFLTALLFVVGKELIGLYLGLAAAGSAFGAAGSLVVLLLWIFYSAQIFLFGAAFTYIISRQRQGEVVPAPQAVQIPTRDRIVQGEQVAPQSTEGESRGSLAPRPTYAHEEADGGQVRRPRTGAEKSLAALTGLTAALLTAISAAISAALLRRRL
jgi:membrane protein